MLKGERLAAAIRRQALAWDSRRPLCCRNRRRAQGLPECIVTRVILPLAGNDGAVGALLVGSTFECTFLYYRELAHDWHLVGSSDEMRFLDANPGEPVGDAAAATRLFIRDLAIAPWRRPASA